MSASACLRRSEAASASHRQAAAPGTVADALKRAAARLDGAAIERARHEARLLVAHALGVQPGDLRSRPDLPLDVGRERGIDALVARRVAREPIAYIVGEKEFWSLPFRVTRDTLIPRPETETVVEAALDWIITAQPAPERLSVLDMGTGSGCLLLALLSELPAAHGIGVDASEGAARAACANARALGLDGRARFTVGDWASAIAGRFDVVVANPPYICDGELPTLLPDIQYEPRRALAGGPDGLGAYRAIAAALPCLLAPTGAAFLEVGFGQVAGVTALLNAHGLRLFAVRHDLSGVPRCVTAASVKP